MTGSVMPSVGMPSRPAVAGRVRRPRMPLVAAGGAVVLACVLGFAVVAAQLGHRVAVLQVARAVGAGDTLAAGDLVRVQGPADSALHLVSASREDEVVGRQVVVPLVAGTLLTDGVVGDAPWPPAGQMSGAVSLKPGRFPADLAAGQHVTVFVRPDQQTPGGAPSATASGDGTAGSSSTPARFAAVVVSVEPAGDGQGSMVVTLLLSADDASTLAAAPDDGVVVMRGSGGL